ncbi:hypothetical protein PLCT2_00958 [Planctomycetaceae bacterium]|nr:hypothetical protein PLCT2_00958 [Planctomycetaceae bacterium]
MTRDRPMLDELIVIKYGDPVLDFGVGTLPKLFSRFYTHLCCTYTYRGQTVEERLSDAEAWLIAQVLLLKSDQDFVLRLRNLPLAATVNSRDDYLAKLRRMGLVFTTRLYYTRSEMLALFGPDHLPTTPRQYAQQWDLTSLFHNLMLIGQAYLDQQQTVLHQWQAAGETGPRPIVSLPIEYRHEIQLPPLVARRIVDRDYDPMPLSQAAEEVRRRECVAAGRTFIEKRGPAWVEIAEQIVAQQPVDSSAVPRFWAGQSRLSRTGGKTSGAARTGGKTSGAGRASDEKRPVRTAHRRENVRSSIDDDVDDQSKIRNELIAPAVFEHFARRKGMAYTPSGRDHQMLNDLLRTGYTLEQILAGIDAIFERGDHPRRFTYCASALQDQSPACPPADPAAPVARVKASPAEVVIPADLSEAAELCRAAGVAVTPEVLTRLQLLADNCISAAQQQQSTGSQWLTAALKRSVGRANDLLAYAEAILQTWIEHGQNADVRPQREGYRPATKAPKSSRETVPRSGRQRRDFEAEVRAGGPA